jgi:hypothetical protein
MNELKKTYTFTDFLFYVCLMAVPLLIALLAIGRHSLGWVSVYVIVSGGMAALAMKYFCTRCPHYTREGKRLRCIFFWNFPKLFEPRPGPLNMTDKLVLYLAPAVVMLFPLPWLFREPGLLIVFLLSTAGFAAAIRRHECIRCIYFNCPMNQASETAKAEFQGDMFNE